MKKITSILLSMVLVLTLVSCGNDAATAKELVTTFSETMQTGDVQKVGESITDQELLDEYNSFLEASSGDVIIDKIFTYLNESTFEAHEAVDNGDGTYSVDVEYTYINSLGILETAMNNYTTLIMEDLETYLEYTPEQLEELLLQTYTDAEATTEKEMISTTVTFTVEKVDEVLTITGFTDDLYDVLTAGLGSAFLALEE